MRQCKYYDFASPLLQNEWFIVTFCWVKEGYYIKYAFQDPQSRISTDEIAEHDLLTEMHPTLPHHRSPSHLSPTSLSPPPSSPGHHHSCPPSPSSQNNFLLAPSDATNHNSSHHDFNQSTSGDGTDRKRNKARRSSSARSSSPKGLKGSIARRHSCAPRSSSFRSQSNYAYRAFPSSPLPHYVSTPQTEIPEDLLTEAEVETMTLLEHWGITKTALSDASPLGVRSPIIGTYRVLLNRILNKGFDAEEEHHETRGSQHGRHKSDDRLNQGRKSVSGRASPLRHRLRLSHNDYDGHTNRSRTCVILWLRVFLVRVFLVTAI